jgi:hypothetical protein
MNTKIDSTVALNDAALEAVNGGIFGIPARVFSDLGTGTAGGGRKTATETMGTGLYETIKSLQEALMNSVRISNRSEP